MKGTWVARTKEKEKPSKDAVHSFRLETLIDFAFSYLIDLRFNPVPFFTSYLRFIGESGCYMGFKTYCGFDSTRLELTLLHLALFCSDLCEYIQYLQFVLRAITIAIDYTPNTTNNVNNILQLRSLNHPLHACALLRLPPEPDLHPRPRNRHDHLVPPRWPLGLLPGQRHVRIPLLHRGW